MSEIEPLSFSIQNGSCFRRFNVNQNVNRNILVNVRNLIINVFI